VHSFATDRRGIASKTSVDVRVLEAQELDRLTTSLRLVTSIA
jgi:hypothetical protein